MHAPPTSARSTPSLSPRSMDAKNGLLFVRLRDERRGESVESIAVSGPEQSSSPFVAGRLFGASEFSSRQPRRSLHDRGRLGLARAVARQDGYAGCREEFGGTREQVERAADRA